jgi:hypothetical protein
MSGALRDADAGRVRPHAGPPPIGLFKRTRAKPGVAILLHVLPDPVVALTQNSTHRGPNRSRARWNGIARKVATKHDERERA